MNDDDLWAMIDTQRLRTADLLERLSADEWSHGSLCEGWTVRDVAGHLTLQQLGLRDALGTMVRYPGSMNRMIRESARARATLPVDELMAQIRAMVGSRRHNVGVTGLETLIDILVHGQDIAIPLGRAIQMPPEAAAAAASRVWSFGGKGKSVVFDNLPVWGLRLVAIDIPWAVGDGPELRGPVAAILLLLTGRRVALPSLAGPGVEQLRQLMSQRWSRPIRPH